MSAERLTSNGRRWPRQKPRPDRWTCFRYLVLREAVYTMGAHPLLAERNKAWRFTVANYSDDECWKFLAYIERAWPARKVRP